MNTSAWAAAAEKQELIAPGRKTDTVTGSAVDMLDYVGNAIVLLTSSAGGGTSPTMTVKITECDTSGGTYTDVTGAAFDELTDAADTTSALILNCDALKRYIKAVATIGGTNETFDIGVSLIGFKQYPS